MFPQRHVRISKIVTFPLEFLMFFFFFVISLQLIRNREDFYCCVVESFQTLQCVLQFHLGNHNVHRNKVEKNL